MATITSPVLLHQAEAHVGTLRSEFDQAPGRQHVTCLACLVLDSCVITILQTENTVDFFRVQMYTRGRETWHQVRVLNAGDSAGIESCSPTKRTIQKMDGQRLSVTIEISPRKKTGEPSTMFLKYLFHYDVYHKRTPEPPYIPINATS